MKFGVSSVVAAIVATAAPAYADPSINGFTIIDAYTNKDYEDITPNMILYRDNLPLQLNLRANLADEQETPGSVQFFVNDDDVPVKTENVAPYALAGDTPPGYYYVDNKYLDEDGTFRITAKPFELKNGQGAAYAAFSMTFTIEEDDTPIIAHNDTCLSDFEFDTDERCSFAVFRGELEALIQADSNCNGTTVVAEIGFLLNMPGSEEDKLEEAFEAICEDALDIYYGFNEVMTNNDVFVTEYFNGGTYWNEGRQSYGYTNGKPSDKLNKNPGKHIKNFYNDYAQTTPMVWPSEITNFNPAYAVGDMTNCEHRAAMCCWVQDRQAGDDNGNCNTPYDENCKDADPADNTDICYHDMSLSPESARVANGISVFAGNDAAGEGAAHCHGFAWEEAEDDLGNLFKANNLFYVSMYDHLYQRGYVRNVPGAPMCGCIEQMPTVSRSDCTQIDEADVGTTYTFADSEFTVEADIEIEFNACDVENVDGYADNDLYSYYMKEIGHTAEQESFIKTKLVGNLDNNEASNCPAAIEEFIKAKFGIEGTA